jgi:hypothetical protein
MVKTTHRYGSTDRNALVELRQMMIDGHREDKGEYLEPGPVQKHPIPSCTLDDTGNEKWVEYYYLDILLTKKEARDLTHLLEEEYPEIGIWEDGDLENVTLED